MNLVKNHNNLFPNFFEDVFKPQWLNENENFTNIIPAVNIKETERLFYIELVIPGFKKEDINIEVEKDKLIVSGEIKNEKELQEIKYNRKEFNRKSFKRVFTLPETTNNEGIEASYKSGILTLTLPKKEEALPEPKRVIAVK